uniref:Secreted protein n=1 Tax=Amblyomma americanum TaxID=6943 RepID=A0A0C9R3T0_AMBAM
MLLATCLAPAMVLLVSSVDHFAEGKLERRKMLTPRLSINNHFRRSFVASFYGLCRRALYALQSNLSSIFCRLKYLYPFINVILGGNVIWTALLDCRLHK